MFWKRKKEIKQIGLGFLEVSPIPVSKDFKVFSNVLIDAEKYDSEGDKETAKEVLKILIEKIQKYCEK